MKKLLIAYIMGALMTGVWAVQQANAFNATHESFESLADGAALDVSDERTDKQWVCEDTDATLKAVAYTDEDTAYTYGTPTANTRATAWSTQKNYLSIDTGSGKPLWRTLAMGGTKGQTVSYDEEAGEGTYVIDTLVQFTGTDTAPTVEPVFVPLEEGSESGSYVFNDKIVLWCKTVEDANGDSTDKVKLMALCGAYNSDGSTLCNANTVPDDEITDENPQTYVAPYEVELAEVDVGSWVRVSVKPVAMGTGTGFVIYLDGKAVTLGEEVYSTLIDAELDLESPDFTKVARYYISQRQYLPPIVDNDTVTKVGFEGSGKIDDVQIVAMGDAAPTFTKYNGEEPPAADTVVVSFAAVGLADGVTWEGAGDVEVTSGSTLTTEQIPATTVEGYDFKGWFSDDTCETAITAEALAEMTFTEATTTIYAKFEAATVTYTVTFAQKGLPEGTAWVAPTIDPVVSGQAISALPDAPVVEGYTASAWQYDDGTAYANEAIEAATTLYVKYTVVETDPDPIAPGATASFKDETKANTWAANKDNIVIPSSLTTDAAKATYKSYLVGTVTGNDTDGYTVTFDIDSTKEADLEAALEEVLPKVLDGTEITTAVPGFYYAVKACDTVGGEYAVKGDWAQAGEDGTVTLSVTKTEGKTAEFYKIVVQAVDPNAAK